MAERSSIEWTDATWNPIRARNLDTGKIGWHCEHVSEACRNCYAESFNKRLGTGLDYKPGNREHIKILLDEKMLLAPLRWKRPRKIFVCSMTDLFGDWVKDEWLDRIFAVMALCPQHTFQLLTKRPGRMRQYMMYVEREALWMKGVADLFEIDAKLMNVCHPIIGQRKPWLPLPNVWLGVTAEDQPTADARIPELLATPAAVRFVSIEPMLGPINFRWAKWDDWKPKPESSRVPAPACQPPDPRGFRSYIDENDGLRMLDWVICGGESGPHARPMHPDWARALRDQCAAGVPFFFKQWGEYLPVGQILPGCGKVHGATAVRPGRMKLHYGGTPKQAPEHAFAERGVAFASTADGRLTFRVGKSRTGRLLDGVEHNAFPEAR